MQWKVGPASLSVKINTEGPLAFLGHDRSFTIPLTVQLEPEDAASGKAVPLNLRVSVEGNLKAAGIDGELPERDRKEILRRKDKDVLETHRYPTCQFSGRFNAAGNALEGSLSLHGQTKPLRLPVAIRQNAGVWVGEGQTEMDLTPFGIKPYKAFMGALRVNPRVTVFYRIEASS